MTDKEVVKGIKQILRLDCLCSSLTEKDKEVLLQAIKWGEAQQEALKELGEKYGGLNLVSEYQRKEFCGYNTCHDIAAPIIAKNKLEITMLGENTLSLNNDILNFKEIITDTEKEIAELQEKIKELTERQKI